MGNSLDVARSFVQAVQSRDADAAAALCADDVVVTIPGVPVPFQVRVTTLTRAPGIFANYTTWHFETDGERIRRLTFELRAAN